MELLSLNCKEKCGVYIITNNVNGKRYIGSSNNLYERIYVHKHRLETNSHANNHLLNAFNKYGDVFQVGILCYCDPSELYLKEKQYIDFMKPEYNIDGIENISICSRSAETRNKIAESVKESYASGKLKDRLALCKNRQICYVYDIFTQQLFFEGTIKEASDILNISDIRDEYVGNRLFNNLYVVLWEHIQDPIKLMNIVNAQILTYKSKQSGFRYLIAKDNDVYYYFRSIPEVVNKYGSSKSTLIRHLDGTSLENPYIITNTKVQLFYSNEFIPNRPASE